MLGRVEKLKEGLFEGNRTFATYTYIGVDRNAKVVYGCGVEGSVIKKSAESEGDAGDPYIGYDRFGRSVDIRWLNSSESYLERIQHGFDHLDRRKWRNNLVATGSKDQDEAYTYDKISQLTELDRGEWTGSAITGSAITENITYDRMGNWTDYDITEGSTITNQSRTHNDLNEITQIDGSSSLIAHDFAGHTTKTPPQLDSNGDPDWSAGYELTWDAWGRLVSVDAGSTHIGSYTYDGLHRRMKKVTNGETRHFYYSNQWQILEERVGTETTAQVHYVWGARPGNNDELVFRQRDVASDGTFEESHYVLNDYYHPTAIVDTNETVVERYGYSAFGAVRFMEADFDPLTPNDSGVGWTHLYGGKYWDGESGFIQNRYRYLNPYTGRWLSRDPIGEEGGLNLYGYVKNNPLSSVDRLGLIGGFGWPTSCAEICARLQALEDLIKHLTKRIGRFLGAPDAGHWQIISGMCKKAERIPLFIDDCCCVPFANEQRRLNIKVEIEKLIGRCRRAQAKAREAGLAPATAPEAQPAGPNNAPATQPPPSTSPSAEPPRAAPDAGTGVLDGIVDWEYWEEVTGLTGAALVIYLILSEGSRLFPPRNLVPIP